MEESGDAGISGVARTEEKDDATPESSRPPSRVTLESVSNSDEEEDNEEEEEVASKQPKRSETPLIARVGKKKGKGAAVTQFLLAYTEMQEES